VNWRFIFLQLLLHIVKQCSCFFWQRHIYWLGNRKHFPCFYRVIETRVEVWEKREIAWEHEVRVFPRNFEFLPNFHKCFYNSIGTRKKCFCCRAKRGGTLISSRSDVYIAFRRDFVSWCWRICDVKWRSIYKMAYTGILRKQSE
jgi:hypothetical protein